MPKRSRPDQYQEAVYINFVGDAKKGQAPQSFYDSDKTTPEVGTIFMYPKEDRDKTIHTDPDTGDYLPDDGHKKLKERRIPFIGINFLYTGEDKEYGEIYDIDYLKTNYQMADELFKEGLKDLKKDSIIYIDGHANTESNDLRSQLMIDGEISPHYESSVTYKHMAEILEKHVPDSAKKGLTIKLMACEPTTFAQNLMLELNQRGFSQTKVIAYNEPLGTTAKLDDSPDSYILFDQFVKSRIALYYKYEAVHGRHLPSSKTVWHNDTGHVVKEDYRQYKDKGAKQELHDLVRGLKSQLDVYLSRQDEGKNDYSIIHRHGTDGNARVNQLFANLNRIDKKIGRYDPERSAQSILKELRDFSKKEGDYSGFSGKIRTNKNSGMTYIVRGMQSFYDRHQDGSHVESLKSFQTPFLDAITSASGEISTADAARAKEAISQLDMQP